MRYYSTLRPVSIGTFPNPIGNSVLEIKNFDRKMYCEDIDRKAWGYIDYSSPLSQKDIDDYELVPGNTNAKLKHCPFCGSNNLYFDSITNDIGTGIPIIFCNSCKIEFHVENDSPYADDESTKAYLHEKNIKAWNNRA